MRWLVGRRVLQLLLSLSFYTEMRFDDAGRLETRLRDALREECLAALLFDSGVHAAVIPVEDEDWDPESGLSLAQAAHMVEALVGACVHDSCGWKPGCPRPPCPRSCSRCSCPAQLCT